MSYDGSGSPYNDDPEYKDEPIGPSKKAWFVSNSGGVGLHPQTWQGWAVLAVAVLIVLVIILLLKRI